jgi:hypothetical protein
MSAESSTTDSSAGRRSYRRWIVAVVLLVLFGTVMWTVINPYRNQPYEEVPHGDHVHYVPKERNEDVPISQFPTRPPNAGERLTPDGKIVPESQ